MIAVIITILLFSMLILHFSCDSYFLFDFDYRIRDIRIYVVLWIMQWVNQLES